MATKKLIIEQMTLLATAHRIKLNEEMVKVYYSVLDICLPGYLIDAVRNLLGSNKFFPKPAEILQAHEMAMLSAIETRVGIGNANKIVG